MKENTRAHRAGKDRDPTKAVTEHEDNDASRPTPKVLLDQGNAVGRQHGGDQDPDPVEPDRDDIIVPDRRGGIMVDERRDEGFGVIAEELGVTAPPRGEDGQASPLDHGEGPHQADPREGEPRSRGDRNRGEVESGEGRRIPIARRKGGLGAKELAQQGQQERGRRKREGLG